MLGTISRDHVVRVVELRAAGGATALVRCAQSLEEFAPDYAQVLDELASLLVRIGLRQAVSDYEGDELYTPELLERLARALSAEDVQLFYQTAIIGRRDLGLAPEPRTGFEMTLLRMIAFRPAGESGVTRTPAAQPAARAAASAAGAGSPPGAGSPAEAAGAADPWASIVNALELSGAARQLASHCVFLGRQGALVRLGVDARNQPVRTPVQEEKLAQALSRYYGEPVRLEFQAGGAGAETPALLARSEERRVGEECRSRWSPDH